MSKTAWYCHSGPEGDVVISTRIRLARNLTKFPFPASMTGEQRRAVLELFQKALAENDPGVGVLRYFSMQNIDPNEALAMVERHLISPDFAVCAEGSGLFINDDETVSMMIGEEDHLRLQVIQSGMALDEAYALADRIDTSLDETLHFAFDDRLGYLTQCPTNLGTAMRASLMLHLPALQERGTLQHLAGTVSKLGMTIRGLYGEGSKSQGAIYQLSNQVTLGISEEAAIANLKSIAQQIIREEREARKALYGHPKYVDRAWRSLGILRMARLLSHDEFMELISNVRAGVAVGCVEGPTLDDIGALINDVQPAVLMHKAGRDMEPAERDEVRAATVRARLA